MDKTYTPADIETKWYTHWESSGAFKPSGEGEPYSVLMPPPNVTGSLHMGHALDDTLQDILIRFERMRGKNTLWQPGTDHAGIATQMLVERQLDGEGIKRTDLGREAFLERVWAWKEQSGGTITQQLRKLGASCDWSREAFTMDEPRQKAVTKAFVEMHKRGLIYRDKRLVNWDPKLKTAISDLEVEQKEVDGNYWHLRYPVDGMDGVFITVATTRPETMLGDTAVAVHPSDERYTSLVGKFVRLPIVGRLIPIVADEYADPEQGSGAVKITPAHDFNDFEVGKRNNLPMINVLDASACINENAPAEYQGLDRFDARKKIVAKFEELGLLDKIEPTKHSVPYGDRGGVVIEPWLTDQWYVDAAKLAVPALKVVEEGKIKFVPENWTKTYYEWMRNIQPWCVSRQLWWGHQIPAWYAEDGSVFVAETEAEAQAMADAALGAGTTITRDEDVLDTWFSSAMWPYTTMGWPEDTDALKTWYPSSTLVTGFDIIFFWVARMVMSGLEFMDEVPFKTVYVHALVRDEKGAKMSKSKGNVIDPIDYVERFGADALRFTLAAMEAQGRDIKMSESRVEGYRNFGTKLWNASRFCQMNDISGGDGSLPNATHSVNKWVLNEALSAVQGVTRALEAYRFNDAAASIYHFTWGTFCDWYIELVKPIFFGDDEALKDETRKVAGAVLDLILKALHPFMPFITEEIWHGMAASPRATDLIHASWPVDTYDAGEAHSEVDWLIRFITEVRSARAEMNVPAGAKASALVVDANDATVARVAKWQDMLCRMARLSDVTSVAAAESKGAAQLVVDEATIYLPLADLMDLDAERARLSKNIDKLSKEAGSIKGRLGNEAFLAKAPEHVVSEAQEQLAELEATIAKTSAALARLG